MVIKNVTLEYTFEMRGRSIVFYGEYCPTNEDNKFRVMDSDNKYLGYLECEDEEMADEIAEEIDNITNINDLLCYLGESAKVSDDIREIHSYMRENEYGEITDYVYSVNASEYFNRLGNYFLAITEE